MRQKFHVAGCTRSPCGMCEAARAQQSSLLLACYAEPASLALLACNPSAAEQHAGRESRLNRTKRPQQ